MDTHKPVAGSAKVFWDSGQVTTHLLVELSPKVATPFKDWQVDVHFPVELSEYCPAVQFRMHERVTSLAK
jgi:hypothetical protein